MAIEIVAFKFDQTHRTSHNEASATIYFGSQDAEPDERTHCFDEPRAVTNPL